MGIAVTHTPRPWAWPSLVAALGAAVGLGPSASATTIIATDNASNYSVGPITSAPPNNGTGFGGWSLLNNGANAAAFVGSTALGSPAFGLAANDTSSTNATLARNFSAELAIGQTFSISMAATAFSSGFAGISFDAPSNPNVLDLSVVAGSGFWEYSVDGDTTTPDTTIPFVANAALQIQIERTAATLVQVTLQQSGSTTWSQSLTPANSAANISSFNVYALDTGGSGNAVNVGFNNLQITAVPEPGGLPLAFLGLGGLGLTSGRLQRHRRRSATAQVPRTWPNQAT